MSSPVQIGTSSWSSVSAGDVNIAAIRIDGRIFGIGNNNSGQVSSTPTPQVPYSSPVQIGTSSWIAVSTGEQSIIALLKK